MNAPLKFKVEKIADKDHGYRVAAEAFQVVMSMDCSNEVRAAVEKIVIKEYARAEGQR